MGLMKVIDWLMMNDDDMTIHSSILRNDIVIESSCRDICQTIKVQKILNQISKTRT